MIQPQETIEDTERIKRFIAMFNTHGKMANPLSHNIGCTRAREFFTMDGKVYGISYKDRSIVIYDYFEFANAVRGGEFPSFRSTTNGPS